MSLEDYKINILIYLMLDAVEPIHHILWISNIQCKKMRIFEAKSSKLLEALFRKVHNVQHLLINNGRLEKIRILPHQ